MPVVINQIDQYVYRLEKPRIYHLDVGAMYPNIILTNRLQVSGKWMHCILSYPFSASYGFRGSDCNWVTLGFYVQLYSSRGGINDDFRIAASEKII